MGKVKLLGEAKRCILCSFFLCESDNFTFLRARSFPLYYTARAVGIRLRREQTNLGGKKEKEICVLTGERRAICAIKITR